MVKRKKEADMKNKSMFMRVAVLVVAAVIVIGFVILPLLNQ